MPEPKLRPVKCKSLIACCLGAAILLVIGPAKAKNTGQIFVSNEKSNSITVLDAKTNTVVRTVETCRRPRGMHFSKDRTLFYVGCADDNQIAVYETEGVKLVDRIRNIEEPETFDLHPNGNLLYVSNEEDATASVVDLTRRKEHIHTDVDQQSALDLADDSPRDNVPLVVRFDDLFPLADSVCFSL